MNDFRCYNCWGLIGYRGTKQTISCSRCNTELFTSGLKQELIEGIKRPLEEYRSLLEALQMRLARESDVYKGKTDVIAGPGTRYKPDAIYYRCGAIFATMPIIYEVITCNGIYDDDTIDRCRLFTETAKNRLSEFYIVTPETCETGGGKQLVESVLGANKIGVAGIITLDITKANK